MIIKNSDFNREISFSYNNLIYETSVTISLNKKFSFYNYNLKSLCFYLYHKPKQLNDLYQNLLFTKIGDLKDLKNSLLIYKSILKQELESFEKEYDFLKNNHYSEKGELNLNEETYKLLLLVKNKRNYRLWENRKMLSKKQLEALADLEYLTGKPILLPIRDILSIQEYDELLQDRQFVQDYEFEINSLIREKNEFVGNCERYLISTNHLIKEIDERIKIYIKQKNSNYRPFEQKLTDYDMYVLEQNEKIAQKIKIGECGHSDLLPITDNIKAISYFYYIYLKKQYRRPSHRKAEYLNKTDFPIKIETAGNKILLDIALSTISPHNTIQEILDDYCKKGIYDNYSINELGKQSNDILEYIEIDKNLFADKFLKKTL